MNTFPARSSIAATQADVVRVGHPAQGVAVVTLDRPASMNALDGALIEALPVTFAEIADDEQVKVVIVTGAGRGFCSGADLSALTDGLRSGPAVEFMRLVGRPLVALAHLPQVTIAAVNGPAIGAGWGLAMACDIRISSTTARFGATFVRMALGPDYGLSHTLPAAVGRERALELLMTGRIIDASEADRIGLTSVVAEDALHEALDRARDIATAPCRTLRSIKATLQRSAGAGIDDVIDEIEAEAQAALFEHPDFLTDAAAWTQRHQHQSDQPAAQWPAWSVEPTGSL